MIATVKCERYSTSFIRNKEFLYIPKKDTGIAHCSQLYQDSIMIYTIINVIPLPTPDYFTDHVVETEK